MVAVNSKSCSKPFLVVTWYRPPCSSAELFSHYETLIRKLDSLDLEYYLMGDLNCKFCILAFVITASFLFVINYLQSLLSKGIQLKLIEILVISIEKIFAGIFLDRIRKAIKSTNPQDWAMYKRLQKRINGEVKSTKASYYASAFIQSNGDSRKTWQLINQLTSRKKNNASVKELKLNGNSITNSHELSNAFNDHFSANGTKLAN
ncbi:unnamed protein product, partial [Porites lobata]